MVAEQFEKMHSTEKIPLILGVVTSHNYCTVPVWPLHGFENIRNFNLGKVQSPRFEETMPKIKHFFVFGAVLFLVLFFFFSESQPGLRGA